MMTFSQLRILVDDFTASYGFYRDVLGLTPQSAEQAAGPYGCFKSAEGADIALFSRTAMAGGIGAEAAERGAADHFVLVLRVPDVDAAYAEALARGAVSAAEPREQPGWGMRVAHLRAPEGTLIEFCSWPE